MRIAILADIHGNLIALDAVLKDIEQRGGADAYWILGDLCAIGYDPVTVLERLAALPNALFVYGNADRYILNGERPSPSIEDALENPTLVPILAEVSGSFAWTQGYVEGRGWLNWLRKMPLEQRLTLPDGTRVLLVHIAPNCLDGHGLHNGVSEEEIAEALADCEADLVCVGHFHMPMDRQVGQVRVMNPGAISNPMPPDLRAAYAILTADENGEKGYQITYRRVDYDIQAVIEANRHTTNPGANFNIRLLEGDVLPRWYTKWDGKSHLPLTQ